MNLVGKFLNGGVGIIYSKPVIVYTGILFDVNFLTG